MFLKRNGSQEFVDVYSGSEILYEVTGLLPSTKYCARIRVRLQRVLNGFPMIDFLVIREFTKRHFFILLLEIISRRCGMDSIWLFLFCDLMPRSRRI